MALKPETAVIFNVGCRDLGGFGENAIVSFTLSAEGYKDQVAQTCERAVSPLILRDSHCILRQALTEAWL